MQKIFLHSFDTYSSAETTILNKQTNKKAGPNERIWESNRQARSFIKWNAACLGVFLVMTNCSLLGFDFVKKTQTMTINRKWKRVSQVSVSCCQIDRFQLGRRTNKKVDISRQLPYDTELEVFLLMLLLSNFTCHMHDS